MLKIFLLTKNEETLIEDWIKYHGHLFGFENLHIIDGSDKQTVFDIYARYRPQGLNVHHSDVDLNKIAAVITECMHRYKREDDFLIKLDTDEFLACINPFQFQYSRWGRFLREKFIAGDKTGYYFLAKKYLNLLYGNRMLHNHKINEMLNGLPRTGQKYKASFTAFSIPSDYGTIQKPCAEITSFTPVQYTKFKSYFHSKSFISVDLGGHNGRTTQNIGHIDTGLVIIHYQNVSIEDSLRRARQVLISHGYIDEKDTPEQCRKKLLDVKNSGVLTSLHKVRLYLKYIQSVLKNKKFSPEMLSKFSPGFPAKSRVRNISLVKDTLQGL